MNEDSYSNNNSISEGKNEKDNLKGNEISVDTNTNKIVKTGKNGGAGVTDSGVLEHEEKKELDMSQKEKDEVDKLTRHQSIILRKFAEEKNNLRYKTNSDLEYLGKTRMKEY